MFVYDSVCLLLIQFRAKDREAIKSESCQIDTWLVPRHRHLNNNPNAGSNATMRQAFYNLIHRGWIRQIGQLSQRQPVSIGGFTREFEYWSGRPVWRNSANLREKHYNHPQGYHRLYNQGSRAWYWADEGNNFVSWDTIVGLV